MLEQFTPVNKQEKANDDDARPRTGNVFPREKAVSQTLRIIGHIMAGKHHYHVAGELSNKECRDNGNCLYP